MKIALVRKNYTHYGGAENYLKLVADGLASRGHEVRIFSSGDWPGKYSVTKISPFRKPSFLSNVLFAAESKRELQKDPADCILSFERTYFQDIYRAGDGCHREWLIKRGRLESVLKRISFSLNPHHRLLLFLENKCFMNSGKIIANSMMVKKDIMKHYRVDDGKIEIVYNGTDLERFRPVGTEEKAAIKERLNIKEEKVVLFAGADFKRKGLPVLLRAFSLIKRDGVRLIAAGKRPKAEFISMAKKFGIEKEVTFWGPEKKIEQLYAVSDLFVLPTIYDPFSNATLEAMASGIAVITTAFNGASEIIEDNVHGHVLKDPMDHETLARNISNALERSEMMGKEARIKAEEYPIGNSIEKIMNMISEYGAG
ncbi:MAG TPA: glycosyltransferase family 1 protein [Nitrospirae bacterium]|nr:glycosyltransferase family 1 protein [Nitrospirota bacterium]